MIGISFLEELSSSLQLAALRGKAILFGTRAESSAGIHGINSLKRVENSQIFVELGHPLLLKRQKAG